jgi:kumamolisin
MLGSELAPPRGARRSRLRHAKAPLRLTLHLRSRERTPGALEQVFEEVVAGRRPPMTRREFAATFGATRGDLATVRAFAAAHGFHVQRVSVARRLVRIEGPGDRLARAFRVTRVRYQLDDADWNSYRGRIALPVELADAVVGVFGFDERPDLERTGRHAMAAAAPTPTRSYTAPEVAALYRFPKRLDGRGQRVGVIALGGGFLRSDMRAYFKALDLPMPEIRVRSVSGARNAPYGESRAYDGEVTGDVQTVGALAPGARIVVYFAPNDTRGFFEAVAAAVHDRRQGNTVLSISWGQGEVHWHRGVMRAFDRVLLEAAVLGVTVCCSSGDWGAFADTNDRVAHVNYPGSSPYVLACGGTTLHGERGTIGSERVWHNHTGASGGGVSDAFPRPSWQEGLRIPRATGGHRGRGVPDVASNADPLTGYRVFVHGAWHVGAGTSASAPLWAGLIARINESRGTPIGLPTPHLYEHFDRLVRAKALVSITRGNNGLFRARKGWDCCTGVGTPRGAALARALKRVGTHRPRGAPS